MSDVLKAHINPIIDSVLINKMADTFVHHGGVNKMPSSSADSRGTHDIFAASGDKLQ